MLILGSNNYIITIKKMLSSKFNMKDLGVADFILGIKISRIVRPREKSRCPKEG